MVGSCWFERPRRFALALVVGGGLVGSGVVAAQQGPTDPGAPREGAQDREVADAIHREIVRDLGPETAHRLKVEVQDGVATLGGSVDDLIVRRRAFAIAEGVRGVREVRGQVQVTPRDGRDDGRIEADAYEALAFDPLTRDAPWQVQVKGGVVTLGGTVEGFARKRAALEAVSSLRGVRDVIDQVQVTGGVRGDELQRALETRFAHDAQLAGAQGIRVTTAPDGTVRLEGTVPSARSRTEAREAALELGAADVDTSGLVVDPSVRRGGALPGGARQGAQGRTLPAGARQTPGDDELEAALAAQLRQHPRLRDDALEVTVKDGRVRLSGVTTTLVGKREAEGLAWRTSGVRGVESAIIVDPPRQPPADDDALEDSIEDAYERHALLSRRDIDVDVENGRVYLEGEVRSAYERQVAADLASRVPGVVDIIDDELEIEGPGRRELLSDEEIKARIERQLFWSPFVSADEVAVTVENGVATLRGQVGSWAEVQAATENALEGGARRVINELTVAE